MSLRTRLLAGMAVVAVVLVGASVVITRTTRGYLVQRVDAQLQAAVGGFQGPGGDRFENGGPDGGPNPNHLTNLYVGTIATDGSLSTFLLPDYGGSSATPKVAATKLKQAATAANPKPFTTGSSKGSGEWRVVVVHQPNRTMLFGLSLHDVSVATGDVVQTEAIATGLILAILGLVTFFVLRLGVRPIKRMTETATAIAGGDLSHRVPDVASGTEAGELGAALNTMLGEIQLAFDQRAESEGRLRQFVADASHELRTPVTTIRGYAELYRSGGLRDPDELTQAMRRTEQESIRMGSLVEDLLLLARLDQGRKLESGGVDLGVLAVDAVSDARAVDPGRPISASTREDVVVTGDESRLRQVVANLVGNALVHTPPGTPVRVRVGADDDGSAFLEVHDDGPGLPPDVAARAFERFYRADPARSRHAGGSGLGLSIVKAIVEAHGGTVGFVDDGPGTTVRVTLPRATVPESSSGNDDADHRLRSGS